MVGTISIAAGWSWGGAAPVAVPLGQRPFRLGERKKAERVGPSWVKAASETPVRCSQWRGVFGGGARVYPAPSPSVSDWEPALAASYRRHVATEIGTLEEAIHFNNLGQDGLPPDCGGIYDGAQRRSWRKRCFIGVVAALASWPAPFAAVALGGAAGALGRFQSWSNPPVAPVVRAMRDGHGRLVHSCGTPTRQAGGLAGLDNDAVNAACSTVGALVAYFCLERATLAQY